MEKWKTIRSRVAFDHPWFKVREDAVRLPNGKVLDDYTVWLDSNVVMVVPITADHQLILVRQYKHGAGEIVIEFPAGLVDRNETPIDAAARELVEETGYQSATLRKIGRLLHNPTKAVGTIHVYLADQLTAAASPRHLDETEEIEIFQRSFEEVSALIGRGEITVSSSIAAFYLAVTKLRLSAPGFSSC